MREDTRAPRPCHEGEGVTTAPWTSERKVTVDSGAETGTTFHAHGMERNRLPVNYGTRPSRRRCDASRCDVVQVHGSFSAGTFTAI